MKTHQGKSVSVEDSYGRPQPQNLELERAVLGALLLERDAFSQVGEQLRPETFYDPRHQVLYAAIYTLYNEQKPVDILTVREYLDSHGDLSGAGGVAYLLELVQNVFSSAHIVYHSRLLVQKAMARKIISYASELLRSAYDSSTDVEDLLEMAEGKLFSICQQNMRKDYVQLDPVLREAYKLLERAAARRDGLSGLSSGFPSIDKVTCGWQNAELIIIAARPAMGKTAFILSMAKKIGIDNEVPCAMFSLEMSNVQLTNRLIMNACEIKGDKLKSGQLNPFEWEQLDRGTRKLFGKPLYLDDTPSLSVFELRSKCRRLVREHGVKVVFIDYLQLLNASGMSFGTRQEEVSHISRSLKGLAKELDIPIIALSQLNRSVEKREGDDGKRPQLSDLRESGAIEQDADLVCFLHRPEYYRIFQDERGHDMRGLAEFIVSKNRSGACDTVLMKFRSDFARFLDLEEENEVPFPENQRVF